MTEPDVLVERHDHVMLLTLNRPQRHNAVAGTMFRDLLEALAEAERDDEVRVVVTTGAGDSFCVGADAAELGGDERPPARELLSGTVLGGEKGLPPLSPGQRSLDQLGNAGRWVQRVRQLDKPMIAAVNGPAVGGGFGLALLHDIVVAGRSARLGTGFAPIGLSPELGISLLLPRIVGLSVSSELLFTGRLLGAEEARELRLVSQVFPDDELLDGALALAERIAAMPPLGVQSTKRLLRRSMTVEMDDLLRAEHAHHLVLFDHPDTHAAMEGLAERLRSRQVSRAAAESR